jgi:predicted DNA-binding transcriptional regulator AlpA
MRDQLHVALELAQTLATAELPSLLGELEEVRATALARLTTPVMIQTPTDVLLTVQEASRALGMSVAYIYQHREEFPFTRRMGRALRFSSIGIQTFLSGSKRHRN